MPAKDTTPTTKAGDLIHPETPYREAMTLLIGERWEAVWAALPAAIEGTDPEGVHDVRVASRRLRAAMDVARDAFPKPWFGRLHKTAKAITGALGDVRDRDVLLAHLGEERGKAKAAERPGFDLLIVRVEAERAAAREDMLRFLRGIDTEALAVETRRRFLATTAGPPADRDADERAISSSGGDRTDGDHPGDDSAGDPDGDAPPVRRTRVTKKTSPEATATSAAPGERATAKKARGARGARANRVGATDPPSEDGAGRMTAPAGRRGSNT